MPAYLRPFAVAAIVAAGAIARADEPAAVSGHVVDAASGRAIAGARVSVATDGGPVYELSTRADGRFSAIGLPAGSVVVNVLAAGLEPATVRCDIPSGRHGAMEFSLHARAMPAPEDGRCALEPETSDVYRIR